MEQSKCLPLYLRPQHPMSSSSSRPRDILLGNSKGMLHEKSVPDSVN